MLINNKWLHHYTMLLLSHEITQESECLCLFLQIVACGGQALTFGADVSKEEDVESMIKTVRKRTLQ